MLFKIFGIQRIAHQLSEVHPKPRQMFVSQSRVLVGRVEEYYAKLSASLGLATLSLADIEQLLPSRQELLQGEDMVDADEEDEWREDLPKRFSELQDSHFPLFLTYDKVSMCGDTFSACLTHLSDVVEQDARK